MSRPVARLQQLPMGHLYRIPLTVGATTHCPDNTQKQFACFSWIHIDPALVQFLPYRSFVPNSCCCTGESESEKETVVVVVGEDNVCAVVDGRVCDEIGLHYDWTKTAFA